MVNIPTKVGSYDNSSVIEKLKHRSRNTTTIRGSASCSKMHLRRQKFNEDFDCAKKYELLAKDLGGKKKKNQWVSQDKSGE